VSEFWSSWFLVSVFSLDWEFVLWILVDDGVLEGMT
jgi:hypothetical protein